MRLWLFLAAANGFLSVAMGAFAAHGLKARLTPDHLALIETGARYQMYHALALIGVAWLASHKPGRAVSVAGTAFTFGALCFSGALYAIGLTGVKALGLVAPVGGTALMVGWIALAWSALRR